MFTVGAEFLKILLFILSIKMNKYCKAHICVNANQEYTDHLNYFCFSKLLY